MKKLLPLFILVFAFAAIAQTDEAVAGKIDDVKSFTKVCIVAQSKKVRSAMLDALKREKAKLEVVDDAETAQFFLELKIFRKKENASNIETVELTAYFYNAEKQKVVVWAEAGPFLIGTEGVSLPVFALTRKFIRDLSGKSGEK